MKFDFIIAIIIAVFLILLVYLFVESQYKGILDPMGYEASKSTFCAEWIKNNCSVLDPSYNRDLAGLGLCEACTPWDLPVGEYPMGKKLDEVEKEMESFCGGEDGVWTRCKKACGCIG